MKPRDMTRCATGRFCKEDLLLLVGIPLLLVHDMPEVAGGKWVLQVLSTNIDDISKQWTEEKHNYCTLESSNFAVENQHVHWVKHL